MFATEAKAFLL